MLLPVAGKPLVLHTVDRAGEAASISRVIVATDDERIFDTVRDAGAEAVMTSPEHRSGSDRIAEVAQTLPEGSIIVNVQGDEPVISPAVIDAAVHALLTSPEADISTTCERISEVDDLFDPNIVKVVTDTNGNALYFSRSPMPFPREATQAFNGDAKKALKHDPELLSLYRKHTGLYVYRREFLLRFTQMPQTPLEQAEMLEQLRALENGARIKVVEAATRSIGVDTPEDFERAKDLIETGIDFRGAMREDLPQIAAVHVESWQRSFSGIAPANFLSEMSVEKRLKAFGERYAGFSYTMIVAEHPIDGIVGFADFGTPELPGNFDSQIYSFYLLPEYQRRGLGERLFRRCVRRMIKEGHRKLCLDSLEVSPYRAFYDKMGGKIIGRDGHKLGDRHFETVIYGWENISRI